MTTDAPSGLAIFGAITGAVGTLLGIFNSWNSWNRDRVKLTVTFSQEAWGGAIGAAMAVFIVKIENRSGFAVTIENAVIEFERIGAPEIVFGHTIEIGEDTETHHLPQRLEAHQAITLTASADDAAVQKCRPTLALVTTGSGIVVRSNILTS